MAFSTTGAQTGTDTDLTGLLNITGADSITQGDLTIYTIPNNITITQSGTVTQNPETERIVFLQSTGADDDSTDSVWIMNATAVYNMGVLKPGGNGQGAYTFGEAWRFAAEHGDAGGGGNINDSSSGFAFIMLQGSVLNCNGGYLVGKFHAQFNGTINVNADTTWVIDDSTFNYQSRFFNPTIQLDNDANLTIHGGDMSIGSSSGGASYEISRQSANVGFVNQMNITTEPFNGSVDSYATIPNANFRETLVDYGLFQGGLRSGDNEYLAGTRVLNSPTGTNININGFSPTTTVNNAGYAWVTREVSSEINSLAGGLATGRLFIRDTNNDLRRIRAGAGLDHVNLHYDDESDFTYVGVVDGGAITTWTPAGGFAAGVCAAGSNENEVVLAVVNRHRGTTRARSTFRNQAPWRYDLRSTTNTIGNDTFDAHFWSYENDYLLFQDNLAGLGLHRYTGSVAVDSNIVPTRTAIAATQTAFPSLVTYDATDLSTFGNTNLDTVYAWVKWDKEQETYIPPQLFRATAGQTQFDLTVAPTDRGFISVTVDGTDATGDFTVADPSVYSGTALTLGQVVVFNYATAAEFPTAGTIALTATGSIVNAGALDITLVGTLEGTDVNDTLTTTGDADINTNILTDIRINAASFTDVGDLTDANLTTAGAVTFGSGARTLTRGSISAGGNVVMPSSATTYDGIIITGDELTDFPLAISGAELNGTLPLDPNAAYTFGAIGADTALGVQGTTLITTLGTGSSFIDTTTGSNLTIINTSDITINGGDHSFDITGELVADTTWTVSNNPTMAITFGSLTDLDFELTIDTDNQETFQTVTAWVATLDSGVQDDINVTTPLVTRRFQVPAGNRNGFFAVRNETTSTDLLAPIEVVDSFSQTFTATVGQTSFDLDFTPFGFISVTIDGNDQTGEFTLADPSIYGGTALVGGEEVIFTFDTSNTYTYDLTDRDYTLDDVITFYWRPETTDTATYATTVLSYTEDALVEAATIDLSFNRLVSVLWEDAINTGGASSAAILDGSINWTPDGGTAVDRARLAYNGNLTGASGFAQTLYQSILATNDADYLRRMIDNDLTEDFILPGIGEVNIDARYCYIDTNNDISQRIVTSVADIAPTVTPQPSLVGRNTTDGNGLGTNAYDAVVIVPSQEGATTSQIVSALEGSETSINIDKIADGVGWWVDGQKVGPYYSPTDNYDANDDTYDQNL